MQNPPRAWIPSTKSSKPSIPSYMTKRKRSNNNNNQSSNNSYEPYYEGIENNKKYGNHVIYNEPNVHLPNRRIPLPPQTSSIPLLSNPSIRPPLRRNQRIPSTPIQVPQQYNYINSYSTPNVSNTLFQFNQWNRKPKTTYEPIITSTPQTPNKRMNQNRPQQNQQNDLSKAYQNYPETPIQTNSNNSLQYSASPSSQLNSSISQYNGSIPLRQPNFSNQLNQSNESTNNPVYQEEPSQGLAYYGSNNRNNNRNNNVPAYGLPYGNSNNQPTQLNTPAKKRVRIDGGKKKVKKEKSKKSKKETKRK
jgi:hypothetical protein